MDLNCLIKLLLEKNIIEYDHDDVTIVNIDDEVIMSVFKFEYEEVFKKVTESEYDKTNICISRAAHDANIFCILNIDNLEKGLIHFGKNRESFRFSKRDYGMGHFPYRKLRKIIEENTRFYVKDDFDLNENSMRLVDEYLESKRIEEEFNKKNEVLDFLSQLP